MFEKRTIKQFQNAVNKIYFVEMIDNTRRGINLLALPTCFLTQLILFYGLSADAVAKLSKICAKHSCYTPSGIDVLKSTLAKDNFYMTSIIFDVTQNVKIYV